MTTVHNAAEIQTPRRRGRPNLNNLRVGIGARLTPEEAEALDALAAKMGFKNRAETIRFIIQTVIGEVGA